ncbi:MAG: nitroreductase family protein [Planctomycetales bacterium]|nr:nitroreductase family protein [Planctomycetales bacterium]
MEVFDAIYKRRAVKHYDSEHELTDDEVHTLMEAAIQSPTSFNIQHWRFVLVRDKPLREQIQAAANDQAQVTDSSLLIVMTADVKAWEKSPGRYWRDAPSEVATMLVSWMGPFYEGKNQLQRDEAMRSCGIAGQTIMLAAKAMGYDSCPMIGFDAAAVGKLINLPGDHVIGFMIAVGKATKPAWPKPGQLPLDEVIINNRFGEPTP